MAELPQPPWIEHRYAQLGDVRLHLAEAGSGPPLILLHGWPQHWWCWRHLIPVLSREYRVIAPDLRGWGWSQAPPGSYAKSTFAKDILALLDHEGLDRVRLLAHDWGAYTAFLLALGQPERIERMVTLDIAPPWTGAMRPRWLKLPQMLSYQVMAGAPLLGPALMSTGGRFVRTIIQMGSGPGMHWSDGDLDLYAEVLREPARARASSACYRTFLTRELPGAVLPGGGGGTRGPLRVPTLLLMGAASPLQRVLRPQSGTNLEVRTIAGAGHFLPEEAPQEVLAHARPFLAG